MIIKKYGIELHRLTEEDIELVRQKRNDKTIREKMFYQKIITKEEQKAWFEAVNDSYNYHFIIHYKGHKIGLISGKISLTNPKEADGGIFIWDTTYQDSFIPVVASICMADVTFFILKMDKTLARVRMDNSVALAYNKKLGYEEFSRNEDKGEVELELTKDNYLKLAVPLRDALKKISKDKTDISWDDIHLTKAELESSLYKNLSTEIQKELDKKKNSDSIKV